ncbi:MAG: Asp-tRNA(Asn)/Glu-tRNA(Gln) amidotransferase subunit GatC [Desulfobulbaceae bacterium]|nr:Asp-tRNA(Asn)/Glu-tRNA(Gln) amidotransferase subunit GatC [Desulfobulbaceae bacterium]
MKITRKEVEHVATLARLELNHEEVEKITAHLDNILNYVTKLDELDTRGIAVTTHTQEIVNAFREDEVHECLVRTKALANAPQENGETFVVPRII